MALFLPQRWRRQPQGPICVDWGNPLSRGLACAFGPIRGCTMSELVSGQAVTATFESVAIEASELGVGVAASGGSGRTRISSGVPEFSSAGFTVVLHARTSAPNSFDALVGIKSGFSGWWGQKNAASATTQFGASYPGVADIQTGVGRPDDGTHVGLSFVVAGSSLTTGCTNLDAHSVTVATVTPGTPNSNSSRIITILGDDANGANAAAGAGVFGALFFRRALSAAETAELRWNPWQVFRPQRRVITSLPYRVIKSQAIATAGDTSTSIEITPAEWANVSSWPWKPQVRLRSSGTDTSVVAPTTIYSPVFLRKRWRRQPPGPVQIDWSNPLTQGLAFGWGGHSPSRPLLGTGSGGSQFLDLSGKTSCSLGRGAATSSSPTNATSASFDESGSFSTAEMSFMLVGQFSTTVNYWLDFVGIGTTSGALVLEQQGSGGTAGALSVYSTGTYSGAGVNGVLPVDGKAATVVVSCSASRNRHAITYFNRVQGSATYSTSQTATITRLYGDPCRGDRYPAMSCAVLLMRWGRYLTDTEALALNENPWQLFRPLRH